MYFGLSEEQQFFKDNVNKFLNDHASLDIVKKIIDNNDNFWSYNDFGGMLEFGIDNYGKKAVISETDIHPTSIVHQLFYNTIIKPKILNEI